MKNRSRKQRGGSLASLFTKKKTPVSSMTTNSTPLLSETKSNGTVMYGRRMSQNTFIQQKQKKAQAAKKIRNHMKKIKNANNATRNMALKMMNNNMRNKTRKMLNQKNLNSLTNDQIIELYTTGKVRSLSQ
jgi:CRISPR/Cas system-associated endonuclease Cas1